MNAESPSIAQASLSRGPTESVVPVRKLSAVLSVLITVFVPACVPKRFIIRREAGSLAMVVLDHETIRSMVPGRFFRDHKGPINSLDFHPTDDVMVTVGARPSSPALIRPPEIPTTNKVREDPIPEPPSDPPPNDRRRRHHPDVPHQ